jgi:hypothetical protein
MVQGHHRRAAIALCLSALLASCAPPAGLPDEEVAPPADDDDSFVDDGSPRLSFAPGDVRAGELSVVFTSLHNATLGDDAMVCCGDENIRYYRVVEQINEENLDLLFFFGLRGDGPAQWGLETGGEEVVGEFVIEPLGDVPALTPGLATTTATISESDAFDVFTFEVPEPNSLISLRASALPDGMHPWLWVLEDDGITSVVSAGFENDEGYQDPELGFFAAEAGTYFLRVDENDEDIGGDDWTCDIDLLITPTGDPMEHVETEPNDSFSSWQNLGSLESGLHHVEGVAATAGHDADNNLNGDMDVFWFEVWQPSWVEFELGWDTDDDFDALLYRGTPGLVALGIGSPQAVTYAMASENKPESTRISLGTGTYVVQVGNWQGDPEVPWSLDMRVVPMDFEE